ncbi:hypothetical protein [Natrinema thermotolerans]|uniref:hypothetical protein n=1 Tax=Natrinema thermotolerans TaxID=121872 RepID=UPI000678729C|nr:hypothetical protein [Natrinema thermotolerans]QCC60223.1 hypothetical protein DVR14_16935 [Natrinema thermotolerans]QCC61133.1 hypothetical protein DVR14_21055 [Natrinema thermotolerans]
MQTLSERVDNGDLDEAIVVGNDLDSAATDLETLGIDVTTEIEAAEDRHLLYESAMEWESADSVVLTSKVDSDRATVSAALANDDLGPVLEQSIGIDDIQSALDSLEAQTVYVTPGVSDSTIGELEANYTVDEATLNGSPQAVASDLAHDTEHVAVTSPTLVHHVSQVGSGENTSLLVTETDDLGSAVTDTLDAWENTTKVYSTNNPVDVQSHTNASVTSIAEFTDLRTGLLVSHEYGVLVSDVEDQGNGNFEVAIRNIGFGTVPELNDNSVTATWSGENIESDPSGEWDDGEYVVQYSEPMEPGETWTVDLSADEVDNQAHPTLDYHIETSDGGLLSSDSSVDLPGISFLGEWWHVALVCAALALTVVGIGYTAWATGRNS